MIIALPLFHFEVDTVVRQTNKKSNEEGNEFHFISIYSNLQMKSADRRPLALLFFYCVVMDIGQQWRVSRRKFVVLLPACSHGNKTLSLSSFLLPSHPKIPCLIDQLTTANIKEGIGFLYASIRYLFISFNYYILIDQKILFCKGNHFI